jgi:hypothetical protein
VSVALCSLHRVHFEWIRLLPSGWPIGAIERDVMDTLGLNDRHGASIGGVAMRQ